MNKKCQLRMVASALACYGIITIQGCATIVGGGGSQEVTFKSEPEGALVVIAGREMGKTPFTSKIDRKANQIVEIKLDGYKSQEFPLATTVNGWFFGNIIFGGLFGSTTDSASGAINEYSPSFYNVTLTPTKTSSTIPSNEVKSYVIANYRQIIEELKTKPGQYVNSLWTLLKISPDKQEYSLAELIKLSETNMDIVIFAEKVSKQLS